MSERETQTREPGSAQPIIEPVLGQCAVIRSPLSSVMSARKRLYRRISWPPCKGVSKIMRYVRFCSRGGGYSWSAESVTVLPGVRDDIFAETAREDP